MKNNYCLMAEIFRLYRSIYGYSKRELARKVGISHTELSRIENCERENYNVVTLINLCKVLHIDFVRLLQMCGYLPCKNGDIDKKTLDYINEFQDSKKAKRIKESDDYCIIAFFEDDFFELNGKDKLL